MNKFSCLLFLFFGFTQISGQVVYLDTVPKGLHTNMGVYELNGKVGFIVSRCKDLSITILKDGVKMEYVTDTCSKEDTVISHRIGYKMINGYDFGTPVYESGMTTVKNKKGKWAVFDSNFVMITGFIYDVALPVVSDPVAAIKKGNLWGFIGNGGYYLKPQYQFHEGSNGEGEFTKIPFDGGVLWIQEETVKKNGSSVKCYVMLKKGKQVYIDKENLTELTPQ